MNRLLRCALSMWLGIGGSVSCTEPSQPRSAAQELSRSALAAPNPAATDIARAAGSAEASTCELEAQGVQQELWQVGAAKDQVGALRMAFIHAQELLAKCQSSEPLWYALVRAIELGLVQLPLEVAGQTIGTAVDGARAAVARCSRSVRIKTVFARLEGTEVAAREALAVDARYAPAALALAVALTAVGKGDEALSILDTKDVEKLPGADTARSATLLRLGKVKPAIAAARREINEEGSISPEPTIRKFIVRDAELAIGIALRADRRAVEAKSHLEIAASLGSQAARELLTSAREGREN